MGLFDALLGQPGVQATGGGIVYDPTKNYKETRFDQEGNAYQSSPDAPLIPGHTKQGAEPMFQTQNFEMPPVQSVHDYGANYYSGEPFTPQVTRPPEPKIDPMSLYNRQGRADYTPQNIVSDEVVMGKPPLGYYPNASERAEAEERWYQEQDKIEATYQALLKAQGIEQEKLEAEDNRILDQAQQDDFNQRVQDRLQHTPDWLGQASGPISDTQREDLNRYTDTDYFGNPLDSDAFGETHYDTNLNRKLDSMNRLAFSGGEQTPVQPTQPSNTTDFFNDRARASKKYQDAVLNIGDTISEGASSLYEGAKDLGSNIDLGGVGESISNVWGDLTKEDDRSFVERMSDTEQNIAQPLREGITDTASNIYDLMQRGEDVAYRGVKGAFDKTIKPLAQDWYNRVTREAEKDVKAYDQGKDVGGLMSQNFGKNMAEIVKGTVDAVASPVETADAIASVFSGALQHALPDEISWNEESKQMASALGQIYAERYGSLEGFKKALAEHPADVMLEVTGVGLLTKLGATKLASKLNDPEFLDKIDELSRQLPETQMSAGMGRSEMFAGTKGAEALGKTDLLNRAEKLEKTGASKDDIWKYTGFIRGQDGNWRFELDSSKMKLKDDVDIQQFEKGGKSDYSLGYFTLERLIDYPELFSAYPELRTINVKIDKDLEGEMAYTDLGSAREMRIPPRGDTRSILEHEVQHVVQSIEGHATGGSPQSEIFHILNSNPKYRDLQGQKADLERKGKPLKEFINNGTPTYSDLYDAGLIDLETLKFLQKENGHWLSEVDKPLYRDKAVQELNLIRDKWESLLTDISLIEEKANFKRGYENYLKLGGEVEAREAQNRLNMSNSQRKSTIPTWDKVADEDVILRFANGVNLSSLPWKMSTKGEGDFYITRVGSNAGKVSKTRQSPNDIAFSTDQDVLLPDYAYYAVMNLEKQLKARAHGTAQQSINKKDIDAVLTDFFQNMNKAESVDDGVLGQVGKDYKGTHTAPISEGKNSLDDFSEIFPDNANDPNFARYYGMGGEYAKADAETIAVMKAVQGNPDAEVTIYRAVPKGTKDINAGDWVSTSKDYTKKHGERYIDGDYDIIEKKVRASELNTDGDLHEWGYNPSKTDDGVLGQVGKGFDRDVTETKTTIRSGDGKAFITVDKMGDSMVVHSIHNAGERKKGVGTSLMKEAIADADRRGLKFASSESISKDAEGVYKRLAKEGYKVEFNKNTHIADNGKITSNDLISPVVTVSSKTNNNSALAIPTGGLLGMGESEETQADETQAEETKDGLLNNVKSWKPNDKLVNFVKMMENAPLAVGKAKVEAYDDVGHQAKGFGTKAGLLAEDTPEEATKALITKLIDAHTDVDRLVKIELNEDERNALVSLVFNVGEGNFAKSKALKALNKGDKKTFLREAFDPKVGFVKSEGKVLKGLVNRRTREKQIFTKGNYGN